MTKDKDVMSISDIDTIELLSKRCRRKYLRARNKRERDKYDRFLSLINERIDKIQDEILKELGMTREELEAQMDHEK